jgi:hypothetical protein
VLVEWLAKASIEYNIWRYYTILCGTGTGNLLGLFFLKSAFALCAVLLSLAEMKNSLFGLFQELHALSLLGPGPSLFTFGGI